MRKFSILICTLVCAVSAIALAETPVRPTNPSMSTKQEVHLHRQQSDAKRLRMPSYQIGGSYDGMMLVIEVSPEGIYRLRITSATAEQEQVCSGTELNSGVAVSATSSFDIELTTESGAQYMGHVDISE